MKFPPYGKLRWRKNFGVLCLFAMCWLVSSCIIEPLPSLRCYPCNTKCIEEQKLICVQGLCVPESNPDPKQCVGYYEGGDEKTEATAETTPEESATPEESVNPEDGAATEQEPVLETEPEKPDFPDTQEVLILQIEGDDQQQPISYPNGITPPSDAKPAAFRFRAAWRVYGTNLQRIDTWKLQAKDNSQTFTLTAIFVPCASLQG